MLSLFVCLFVYVVFFCPQDAAAKVGTSALSQLYGTNYVVGSSTNVLCKSSDDITPRTLLW